MGNSTGLLDVGRPTVQTGMGQVVIVILAQIRKPHGTQLNTSDLCHVTPKSAIPGSSLGVGIGE